jgi:hypothetical protein
MTHGTKREADAIPSAVYFPLTQQVVQHANLVVMVTGWVNPTLSVGHGQLSAPIPVIPCMTREDVPKLGLCRRSPFDGFADRREGYHLGRRVRNRQAGARPARPHAAVRTAAAALGTPPAAVGAIGRLGAVPAAIPSPVVVPAASAACGAFRRCRCGLVSTTRGSALSHSLILLSSCSQRIFSRQNCMLRIRTTFVNAFHGYR